MRTLYSRRLRNRTRERDRRRGYLGRASLTDQHRRRGQRDSRFLDIGSELQDRRCCSRGCECRFERDGRDLADDYCGCGEYDCGFESCEGGGRCEDCFGG